MNTYYSLAACTLATYGMSALVCHEGKLDMVRALLRNSQATSYNSMSNHQLLCLGNVEFKGEIQCKMINKIMKNEKKIRYNIQQAEEQINC